MKINSQKNYSSNGSKTLISISPSKEEPVFLPDANTVIHNGLELHSKYVLAMDLKDARRLRENFKSVYENGLRLASELRVEPLVDKQLWDGQVNAIRLSEEFPLLIPTVLSIFAFSTDQSRGVGTKTFARAIDALRKTRVIWVDSLEAGLWDGEVLEARTNVPAFWISKENTLLAVKDAQREVSKLSDGLASIVDRGDIDVSLKFILKECQNSGKITEDVLLNSLSELKITADNYQEVQLRWLGDIEWRMRLVKPIILLLDSKAELNLLEEVSSEFKFIDILKSYDYSPLKYYQ